jgi:hypothetical protein
LGFHKILLSCNNYYIINYFRPYSENDYTDYEAEEYLNYSNPISNLRASIICNLTSDVSMNSSSFNIIEYNIGSGDYDYTYYL